MTGYGHRTRRCGVRANRPHHNLGANQAAQQIYAEMGVRAEDIAEILAFAFTCRRRVTRNEILVRPTGTAMTRYVAHVRPQCKRAGDRVHTGAPPPSALRSIISVQLSSGLLRNDP